MKERKKPEEPEKEGARCAKSERNIPVEGTVDAQAFRTGSLQG